MKRACKRGERERIMMKAWREGGREGERGAMMKYENDDCFPLGNSSNSSW